MSGQSLADAVRYVQVFKNHGVAAGASMEHGHAQLIALPIGPAGVREELDGASRYRERTGRCVFCDLLVAERREGSRIVLDDGDVVVLAPWAPRVPHETWLVPARHEAAFEETGDAMLGALARALRETLARLRRALGAPDYNLVLHTAPCGAAPRADYHWHLEVLPRLVTLGGFEWGTGVTINTMPPEEAAETLRRTEI
jgi:UDPglucose--hexose-1-phosphate uridylyltransferase